MGCGTHLNLSLWDIKGQKNVLYDADKPNQLSDVCRHFTGADGALSIVQNVPHEVNNYKYGSKLSILKKKNTSNV